MLAVLAGVALVSSPVFAQSSTTGQITGEVRAQGGGPLPGATIVATSPALQGERAVTTGKDGKFVLPVLPPGIYTLKVTMPGHQTLELGGVAVQLGRITAMPVALKEGEIVEAVTVTAEFPLIQKKTADTTVNLGAKTLDTIPTAARSFRDLTKYVPSVTSVELNTTDASTTGFPSIRGEGQYGDNYLIDGLTVRDPSVKTTATPLNYDAIEEVQIITDGFSPEYGQSLGGSVNVITKSGSNTFGGEVAYLYDSDSLGASFEPTILATPSAYDDSTPYVNLGGPILKDKLWYFFSYDRPSSSDTFAPVFKEGFGVLPEGVTDVDDDIYFGKVSWAITANHNLSANYTYRDGGTSGLEASSATPEARRTQDVTDKRLRLNYQAIFTPDSVLEVKYGKVERDIKTLPLGSLDAANYELVSYSVNTNNAWREQLDERKRDDYALIYSHFFNPGGRAGSHELKGGYEVHKPEQNSGDNFSGLAEDVFATGINPDASDFGLPDTFGQGAKFTVVTGADQFDGVVLVPSVLNEYRSSGVLKNSSEEEGYFLQDRWEVGRWNFLGGFRADKQKGFNDANQVFSEFDFNRSFSPRVSVTWDSTGDGKNIWKAGWGRFFDVNSTRFGEFANTREAFSFRTYEWVGPGSAPDPDDPSTFWPVGEDFRDHIDTGDALDIHNPANWGFATEQSNEANPLDYSGVTKPARVERLLVEYDRQIKNNYALKTRYVIGKSRGLIDDINYFYNNYRVENTDLKRRDYQSFEVEFNGNPSPNFSFNASWVHSAAKGTNPGQFESSGFLGNSGSGNDIGVYLDRPPSNPQGWCDLYGPTCVPPTWNVNDPHFDFNNDNVVNQFDRDLNRQILFGGLGGIDGEDGWYGYLPYSIDDLLKVYSRFNIPKWGNTYITAFLQWTSGYHTQRRGYQGLYGDYLSFSQGYNFAFVDVDPNTPPCSDFADCDTVLVTTPVPGQEFSEENGIQRGTLTNSAFWSLDLSVGKQWNFGKRFGVELRAEVFNVFDKQMVLAIQDRATSEFGEALTRVQPRSGRVFARLSF